MGEYMNTMKRRASRASNVSISIPLDMREVLQQAAYDDNRSVSSLISALVNSYLVREGYCLPRNDFRPLPPSRQTRLKLY